MNFLAGFLTLVYILIVVAVLVQLPIIALLAILLFIAWSTINK